MKMDPIITTGRVAGADSRPFQWRVQPWMLACFNEEIAADEVERCDRLVEEVFEAVQTRRYDPGRILALRDYVWGRPVGETYQEVGGVMVTLAAFCLAVGVDMHAAGETELARIWTKVEKIRAKQASKPTGSALPIPIDDPLTTLRAQLSAAIGERDRIATAAENLRDQIIAGEEHGDGAAEEGCPICDAIAQVSSALSTSRKDGAS